MTSSLATLQRRVVTLRRDYELKSLGNLTIVSDGCLAIRSDTGKAVTDAELEKLRRKRTLVWRMYPKGFLNLV